MNRLREAKASQPDSPATLNRLTQHGRPASKRSMNTREMVRAEHLQASFEAEIVAGLASGDSTPMTADDWSALRRRARTN